MPSTTVSFCLYILLNNMKAVREKQQKKEEEVKSPSADDSTSVETNIKKESTASDKAPSVDSQDTKGKPECVRDGDLWKLLCRELEVCSTSLCYAYRLQRSRTRRSWAPMTSCCPSSPSSTTPPLCWSNSTRDWRTKTTVSTPISTSCKASWRPCRWWSTSSGSTATRTTSLSPPSSKATNWIRFRNLSVREMIRTSSLFQNLFLNSKVCPIVMPLCIYCLFNLFIVFVDSFCKRICVFFFLHFIQVFHLFSRALFWRKNTKKKEKWSLWGSNPRHPRY